MREQLRADAEQERIEQLEAKLQRAQEQLKDAQK